MILILGDEHVAKRKEYIYRQLAWITTTRYQLRLSREWKHSKERIIGAYIPSVYDAYFDRMHPDLLRYSSPEELRSLSSASNVASRIVLNQSKVLQSLQVKGSLSDYKHVKLQEIIGWLYDEQGKCERIKNFPFPRQYTLTALSLTFIFAVLIPFGMNDIFATYGKMILLSIPFSALIIKVFFLMEQIGDYS